MPAETHEQAIARLAVWLLETVQNMDEDELADLECYQSIGDEIPASIIFEGADPDTYDVEPGHGGAGVWTGIGPWDNTTTVESVAAELQALFEVCQENEIA